MVKIEHLALYVEDLEKMKSFYETYLLGKAGEKYHNPNKGFTSYFISWEEGARLELMHREDLPQKYDFDGEEKMGLTHLAISLGSALKVDFLTERLRVDGFEVVGEPRWTGDGYYESVVLDPEGNRLELTA